MSSSPYHQVASFFRLACAVPLLACASVAPEAPRTSLGDALAAPAGGHVRIVREDEDVVGYVDRSSLATAGHAEGERRARSMIAAACTALELDCRLLGPLAWGGHPTPSACVPELWPGTREATTSGLCVVFDRDYRPMWMMIRWSTEIAARRDSIRTASDVLEHLDGRAPTDGVWVLPARLSLEKGRPIYRFSSTSGAAIESLALDAATGAVVDVRRTPLSAE